MDGAESQSMAKHKHSHFDINGENVIKMTASYLIVSVKWDYILALYVYYVSHPYIYIDAPTHPNNTHICI